jgi:hypothetical protein
MRELTDYKRGFLRAIEKRDGELVMRGKHAHRTLDHLVDAGYASSLSPGGRGRICSNREGERRLS